MLRNSLLATSLLALCACGPTTSASDIIITNTGGASSDGSAGSGGSTTAQGGSGGTTTGAGGGVTTGGSDAGGADGSGGTGGEMPMGPYSPRSGPFKMLVLTRTAGYRHAGSIETGLVMLQQIATEQGFEIVRADDEDAQPAGPRTPVNEIVTPEGLAPFEIVFHLNTTGDLLNDQQQATYEDWMTNNNGAYAGVHSATDTEKEWPFYSEVTGQYYNGHGTQNEPGQLQFESGALDHVILQGLPNPWQRNEEWYRFDNHQVWTAKPGFTVLARKAADGQPGMWVREWGNFRAFYTCLGHANVVFDDDADIKKLLTSGIMWAVRREHLIQ